MLTEQMKKDLANPADVINIITTNMARFKIIKDDNDYKIATSYTDTKNIEPRSWHFGAQDLRETAAVFNALADTMDKQNGW